MPLLTLLPPSIFLLEHVAYSQEVSTCPPEPSLRARLWPLYSLSFLPRIAGIEETLVKVIAAIVVAILLFTLAVIVKHRTLNYQKVSLLLLSCACAPLAIIGPDCVGSGSYIHVRMVFYAFLFLVAWVACAVRSWPRPALNVLSTLVCGITVVTFIARYPVLSEWNDELSTFVDIGRHIRPRATILALSLESQPRSIDPFLHAAGLLSERVIIDLRNYEASTDYFSTRFQPEYSPFPALGTLKQLQSVPPVFDTVRYEKTTKGRVDYLLFRGRIDGGIHAVGALEGGLIRNELAGYTLVRSEESGNLTLYRRNSSATSRGGGR